MATDYKRCMYVECALQGAFTLYEGCDSIIVPLAYRNV